MVIRVFLSTRNHEFAKIMREVINLQAHYPEVELDKFAWTNVAELSSRAFNENCMALWIEVQHYIHTSTLVMVWLNPSIRG